MTRRRGNSVTAASGTAFRGGNGRGGRGVFYGFCLASLGLFALFAVLTVTVRGSAQHEVFFMDTTDCFMDFANLFRYTTDLRPYDNPVLGPQEKPYPALTYVIFYGVNEFGRHLIPRLNNLPLLFISLTLTFGTTLIFLLLYRLLGDRGNPEKTLFAASIFFSGLFLHSYERGNLALLTAAAVLYFVVGHRSENCLVKETSLLVLAFAAGLKCSPAVFGVLLLVEHDFKAAARLAIYGLFFIVVPFGCLDGGFGDMALWFRNFGYCNEVYLPQDNGFAAFGLASLIQRALTEAGCSLPVIYISGVLRPLALIWSVALLAGAFFERTWWKVVAIPALVMILAPTLAFRYTGLYLLAPLALFFCQEKYRFTDWFYVGCFLLILNPVQLPLTSEINLTPYLHSLGVLSLACGVSVSAWGSWRAARHGCHNVDFGK